VQELGGVNFKLSFLMGAILTLNHAVVSTNRKQWYIGRMRSIKNGFIVFSNMLSGFDCKIYQAWDRCLKIHWCFAPNQFIGPYARAPVVK
jgi:hypothetical protein